MSVITSPPEKGIGRLAERFRLFKIARAGKWTVYFILIGVIAGLGSIVFHYLCELGVHYFMDLMAGYRPPSPAGEHRLLTPTQTPFNRWILLFLPALGGLCTGIIGFFLPQTLSFGYGFAQMALKNELTISFLLLLAFGKVLTTSFSIGSGGSGGVFGPSMVIGGAVGGVIGKIFHGIMPGVITQPGAFVVVGMAGFFTAVSNTPISTIIFVSEMTGSYHLLLPSLLVCSVSYLAARRWTIFEKQAKSKVDSPAHAGDFFVDILQAIRVQDLMSLVKKVDLIPRSMPFLEFKKYFSETTQHYFPVMDEGEKLVGIFSVNDVRAVLFSQDIEHLVVMEDIATKHIIVTTPADDLNSVLQKFTTRNIDSLPVVKEDDPGQLIGMLNRREVISFYNRRIAEIKQQAGQ